MQEWFDKARASMWCSRGMAFGALAVAAGALIVLEDGVLRFVLASGALLAGLVIGAIRLLILQYAEDYRGRRTCCPKCGYDLTGNVSGVCPECGLAVPRRKAE